MSHILHFYHLVALDYVIPTAVVGGVPTPINRPFLCPRYDDNHYLNTARVGAMAGLMGLFPVYGPALGVLTSLPGGGVDLGGSINAYLTGQYLKALDIRRKCHELQAIFSGRAPQCSGWTPGGATASVTTQNITDAQNLLNQIKAFVGEATDFATGTPGTMMFDVVAAAHVFPEYFWIGNTYHQFMAFGVFEEAGTVPLSPGLQAVYGVPSYTNPDQRGLRRGYKLSAQAGAAVFNVDIMKIGESIAGSRYNKQISGAYPDGSLFKHPWAGMTQPKPLNEYSWLKSPRYDLAWQLSFIGPLAGWLCGFYSAGISNVLSSRTSVERPVLIWLATDP
jgi:hydrogenase large subunit